MIRTASLAFVVLWAAACGPEGEADLSGEDGLGDDVLLGEPSITSTEAGLGATASQVIFVNFNGPTVCNASNFAESSVTNHSWVICSHWGICGTNCLNFAAFTTNATERSTVVSKLRSEFSAFNVSVVTTRPASGPYTMLVVSPTSGPHHGVSELDCGNSNRNGIAFVYATGSSFYPSIGGGSPGVGIAKAAAHELGHSFGLGHRGTVSNPSADHMDVWSRGTGWTIGATSDSANCVGGTGHTQNAPALLRATLGTAP
jgi:hypothetical protein